MKNKYRNRPGVFHIPRRSIFESPDLVKKIMSQMLIVRAEDMFVSSRIEYVAYSHLFDEVDQGSVAPHYEILVSASRIKAQRKPE